jgi:thymidylate synthase (FAD)
MSADLEPTHGVFLRTSVLDHGYIQLVESWGSEEGIIEAARMSTGKGFLGWGVRYECPEHGKHKEVCCEGGRRKEGDEKLLRFLYENSHSTPFEMAGATFEVQAPIFVFREWHRHRVPFSYNEMSARYTPLPDLSFLPKAADAVQRSEAASKKNKQAGVIDGAAVLTHDAARDLLMEESDLLVMVEDLYQRKLKAGFPKELARTHLTVSRYSRMRASANLRGWLAFLTLREAPGAQAEIRAYATALHEILKDRFPRTLGLFEEGRK